MSTPAITSFSGRYRFLSNFWPAPIQFSGLWFKSVEHAYVAAKTNSQEVRKTVAVLSSPGRAKRYGRAIELRPDWDEVKLKYMQGFVLLKFHPPLLRDLLLCTGDAELIEGNTWGDTYWGVCDGVGENHLGKILMGVRTMLNDEEI